MTWSALAALAIVLAVAPALPGVATRTKSFLTGRRGAPIMQLYSDLAKLVRKQPVYSATTTWIFRAAPIVTLVGVLLAACLLPLDGRRAIGSFAGDFVLFAGFLALGRLFIILAALDTGSSFEGMGASREAMVGTYAEAALFLVFAALALATGQITLASMLGSPLAAAWPAAAPSLVMVGIGLLILLLAESSRVPVDDPATHLELTMIHEVAVLDHGGPDLAMVLYGSAMKFALFGALAAGVLLPRAALPTPVALALLPTALVAVAILVGVVEATMARLRLNRIPQLLVAVSALVIFATILLLRPA
jgi:formate hydrogenlyase subunit 4